MEVKNDCNYLSKLIDEANDNLIEIDANKSKIEELLCNPEVALYAKIIKDLERRKKLAKEQHNTISWNEKACCDHIVITTDSFHQENGRPTSRVCLKCGLTDAYLKIYSTKKSSEYFEMMNYVFTNFAQNHFEPNFTDTFTLKEYYSFYEQAISKIPETDKNLVLQKMHDLIENAKKSKLQPTSRKRNNN